MILLFDVDGVLADTPWTREEWDASIREKFDEMIPDLKLRWEEAPTSLNRWSREHWVGILSARPERNLLATRLWLWRNGFFIPRYHLGVRCMGGNDPKNLLLETYGRGKSFLHFDDNPRFWHHPRVGKVWTDAWGGDSGGDLKSWRDIEDRVNRAIRMENLYG